MRRMATVEVAHANLTPFRPGSSANPGGLIKGATGRLMRSAQGRGELVLDQLEAILTSPKQPAMARVRAGEVILDRGYGKASDGLALMLAEEATSASVELGVRFVMGSRRVEFSEEAALPVIEQPPAAPGTTNGPVGPPASS